MRRLASGRVQDRAPWRWAVAGAVLGALVTLVLQFPARWVAGGLHAATGGAVSLADVRGTVWDGSGVLVIAGGAGSLDAVSLPGRLAWRLRPGRLPGGAAGATSSPGLVATLTQDCCLRQPLRASATHGGEGVTVRLDALDWHAPAQLLSGLGAPWNTLGFDGLLRLSGSDLQLRRSPWGGLALHGRLVLAADGLSSRISHVRPLGSYRLELDGGAAPGGDGGGTQLTLATLDGPLQLSGEGAITPGGLRLRALARAEPAYAQDLANVLGLIGNRDGPVTLRTIR